MSELIFSISDPIVQILRSKFQSETRFDLPLGSELLIYEPPHSASSRVPTLSNVPCYLIWSGHIRLLHQHPHLQREISTSVLKPGDLLGADHLFHKHPLSYRAIAAGSCQVVQVFSADLACLLEAHPCIQPYIQQQAQERERLIFFKCFTPLGSHPSKVLQHQLLPHLTELHIAAGTSLAHPTGDRPTQVWLRAGKIINPTNPAAVPQMGDSWQEGTPSSDDWIAGTDLILYKLLLPS